MVFYPTKKHSKPDIIKEEQRVLERPMDPQVQEVKENLAEFLRRVPASFVSEMAWEIGASEYMVKEALRALRKEGLVEEIPVNWNPDPRLLARVPDQSSKNQGGIANFAKKRWFGMPLKVTA